MTDNMNFVLLMKWIECFLINVINYLILYQNMKNGFINKRPKDIHNWMLICWLSDDWLILYPAVTEMVDKPGAGLGYVIWACRL